ncbi:MAG: hypothetical protein LKE33_09700 [Acidaminococcus sp.]|jgi:hypothetical protein|nr:hypothetical protein [Acidaminococcus sp.]MCI2117504.1 hypothetical protein [Acidaminococcus sp.]
MGILGEFFDLSLVCMILLPGCIVSYMMRRAFPPANDAACDKVFSYFISSVFYFVCWGWLFFLIDAIFQFEVDSVPNYFLLLFGLLLSSYISGRIFIAIKKKINK